MTHRVPLVWCLPEVRVIADELAMRRAETREELATCRGGLYDCPLIVESFLIGWDGMGGLS